MKVTLKVDLRYLIDCYDLAIKVNDDKIIDYIFIENLDCGICRKLFYNKNSQTICNKGIKFIKKNKSLFDDELFGCSSAYWFLSPMNYSQPIKIRKLLQARKTVLEGILATL